MLDGNRVVAIIPARMGSKRLPNKNILLLAGKPLIAWTIEAALKCEYIDEVVVSTDSELIIKVAEEFGAKVPFVRPKSLSGDMATTDDVVLHAIEELKLSPSDVIVLLQPTSPLRNVSDIDSSLKELKYSEVLGVVSVCKCEHSPLWSNILPENLSMEGFIKTDISTKRSQDLPTFYRLNGAIYAYKVSYLTKFKMRHYSKNIKSSIMPIERSVDIDNQFDFDFANFLMGR